MKAAAANDTILSMSRSPEPEKDVCHHKKLRMLYDFHHLITFIFG
jgi:hypothetical protein